MLIRRVVPVSDTEHKSEAGLICVHSQAGSSLQRGEGQPWQAVPRREGFLLPGTLQQCSGPAAFMACLPLEGSFVLDFTLMAAVRSKSCLTSRLWHLQLDLEFNPVSVWA